MYPIPYVGDIIATIALVEIFFALFLIFQSERQARKLAYFLLGLFGFTVGTALLLLPVPITIQMVARHLRFFSLITIPFLLYYYLRLFPGVLRAKSQWIPGMFLGLGIALISMHVVSHYHLKYIPVIPSMGDIGIAGTLFSPNVFKLFDFVLQTLTMLICLYSIVHALLCKTYNTRKRLTILIVGLVLFVVSLASLVVFRFNLFQESLLLFLLLCSVGMVLLLYGSEISARSRITHARMAFETFQDGVLVLGTNQVILDYTPQAKAFIPELDDSYLGRTLSEASKTVHLLQAYQDQTKASGMNSESIIQIDDTKTYIPKFFEIRLFSSLQGSGRHSISLLIIRDMSDYCMTRKKLQENHEKLLEVNRLKSMVIGIMAHDLRSPLVAMKSMRQLMNTSIGTQNPEFWKQTDLELDALIDRADGLINNLLSLSVVSEKSHAYPINAIDVESILQAIPKAVQHNAVHKGVHLVYQVEDNALVVGNLNLCTIALRNILENAIKYSQKGQKVELRISIKPDTVWFEVLDEGTTIGKDALSALSEDRWGSKTLGTSGEKGPGLGLYATKKFLLYQGGSLHVEPCLPNGTRAILIIQRAFPKERRFQ
ncbi:sensor histidine kinase [Sphaerochaeta sp.]|uniref:sensor histidine kinase n=1 Tax=Sphaerochaeta sp. TaxID=1972642 RepID=UPI002FC60F71